MPEVLSMRRKITLFKGYKRLNVPVEMTKKCRAMFPRGASTGTLIRLAGDGRWLIRKDGNQSADYWSPGLWRKLRSLAMTEVLTRVDEGDSLERFTGERDFENDDQLRDRVQAAFAKAAERQRLADAIVEAAKEELTIWEGFHTAGWTAKSASARNKLRKATRELIEFEKREGAG